MSTVAIIQARMGSTRLPGKVSMEIAGKPMLWHVLYRVRYSALINKIGVATTINSGDNVIEALCKTYDIECYRGSERDVLDRYYQAARLWEADAVVRITADCPLIDPSVTDRVISSYLENREEFVGASNVIRRTFPRGLDTEIFSFSTLERMWHEAKGGRQRAHVTLFMYENPGLFKVYSVEQEQDLSKLRWTIDEDKDFEFVREIYERLYEEGKIFLMEDILKLLDREPSLKEVNKDVRHKVV